MNVYHISTYFQYFSKKLTRWTQGDLKALHEFKNFTNLTSEMPVRTTILRIRYQG